MNLSLEEVEEFRKFNNELTSLFAIEKAWDDYSKVKSLMLERFEKGLAFSKEDREFVDGLRPSYISLYDEYMRLVKEHYKYIY